MGSDKEKKPKTGWYRFGSGLIWAGGQWAVEWFLYPEGDLRSAFAAVAGGFAAGWVTAAILGKFAKWGLGWKPLMAIGLVLGVTLASGAVHGLSSALSWWSAKKVEVDWEKLRDYLISWRVAPSAALGLLTGLYVRAKIPKPKKGKE